AVACVNDAPAADNASYNATDDTLLSVAAPGVLDGDTDADGDTLSAELDASVDNGSLTLNSNGSFSYTPADDFCGADSFTYHATDGTADSNIATVSIAVACVNDAPVANGQSVSTPEDTALAITLTGSDADGDTLSFTVVTGPDPAKGTLSGTAPNLTYTPLANFNGADSFTFVVNDGTADSSSVAVALTINPVNDQPELASFSAVTIDELSPFTFNAADNLSDPDDLNDGSGEILWSLGGAPEGMTISSVGVISWIPGEASANTYNILIEVQDGLEDGSLQQSQGLTLVVVAPDRDGDDIPDYDDNCPDDENTDQADLDEDGLGDICDGDDDGDGISDVAELANGLNPRDAADALLDLDGDGLSNLEEFQQCVLDNDIECEAISTDSDRPTITVSDTTVVSTGYVTPVTIPVTAFDSRDGEVPVTADKSGPFRPGRHVITWTATDSDGNSASEQRNLDVLPLVTLAGSVLTGEGRSIAVPISLNGLAPSYPVTLDYTVAGVADSADHDLADGSLQISSGAVANLLITITDDAVVEGDEEFVITLTDASENAVLSDAVTYRVIIVERNIAPSVSFSVLQSGISGAHVYKDQGEVVITAIGADPNGDSLTYDWSSTDGGLGGEVSGNEYRFDAASTMPAAGAYEIRVVVSDGILQTSRSTTLMIGDAAPILSDANDSDNDGVGDFTEGRGDADNDALQDFRDAVDDPTQLHARVSGNLSNYSRLIRANPGMSLSLGRFAIAASRSGARISSVDVRDAGGQIVADTGFSPVGAIYDFGISGFSSVDTAVSVVIPLVQGIPLGAKLRGFAGNSWLPFFETATDGVRSAASVDNECPPPGDPAYRVGLIAFNDCVQLTLSDGGANDTDGEANGVIRGTFGLAIGAAPVSGSVNDSAPPAPTAGPQGGGSPDLLLLMFLLLLLLLRTRHDNRGIQS
ncbi:MAG: tandem-95 repeat protein, partial [Gammaproteobacteria bacterium]|nr:tandem-95 repeat protein [Gammaproteobacteria bacterium]